MSFEVRQGSVLSPVLFAVYIDDICKLSNVILGTTVVLYADDILLIAPSVSVLQKLLLACEEELDAIDMIWLLMLRSLVVCVWDPGIT